MNDDLLQIIGDISKKVIFAYNYQDNRIELLSPAFEKVWEMDRQRALEDPSSLLAAVHPEDRQYVLDQLRELSNGSAREEMEFRLQLSGEEVKFIKAEAGRYVGESGESAIVAGFAQDVSREHQYESYLLEFAHRKNSALEIVSHDLRGPLAMVQGIASALEQDYREGQYEEISNYARFIHKACQDSLNLINDLLSEEHLRSPKIIVKKERADLVAKAQRAVDNFRSSPSITQTFELQASPDQVFAEVDKVKTSQILNNLLSNAIKFTPPEGRITVTVREEKRRVLISVADNGVGIPKRLQPFLFDRYSKASRPGLRGESSRGIGLSIVRDLVEVQGGKIWAESEEQKGSTFYVSLPK
jgi:signal transduction histidine kinase